MDTMDKIDTKKIGPTSISIYIYIFKNYWQCLTLYKSLRLNVSFLPRSRVRFVCLWDLDLFTVFFVSLITLCIGIFWWKWMLDQFFLYQSCPLCPYESRKTNISPKNTFKIDLLIWQLLGLKRTLFSELPHI